MWEKRVPEMSATRSFDTSSSAIFTASPGFPASSRDTSSSGRPSTPPAALISSSASSTPIL